MSNKTNIKIRGSTVVGLDNAYLDQTKNPTIFDYVQRWKAAQKYNNFAKKVQNFPQ